MFYFITTLILHKVAMLKVPRTPFMQILSQHKVKQIYG